MARTKNPAAAVLAALSAEPGGATVTGIAGRARAEGAAAGAVRLGVQPRHPRRHGLD
jgi:hypothetical protein